MFFKKIPNFGKAIGHFHRNAMFCIKRTSTWYIYKSFNQTCIFNSNQTDFHMKFFDKNILPYTHINRILSIMKDVSENLLLSKFLAVRHGALQTNPPKWGSKLIENFQCCGVWSPLACIPHISNGYTSSFLDSLVIEESWTCIEILINFHLISASPFALKS